MNCRSCGASLPQGVAYCPACKQPIFYAGEDYRRSTFPPPPVVEQHVDLHGANPWRPTSQQDQAGQPPYGSRMPQGFNAAYPAQFSSTPAQQPTTENLSPSSFGPGGEQFSPITGGQSWSPPPPIAPPGQPFANGIPPYNTRPVPPQTQPFTHPAPPSLNRGGSAQPPAGNAQNGWNFAADSAFPSPNRLSQNQSFDSGIYTNAQGSSADFQTPMPRQANPSYGGDSSPSLSQSGTFPRPTVLPSTTEKSFGLLSGQSSGRFPASKAQPAQPETASRFLYGRSPSGGFPNSMVGQASPGEMTPFSSNPSPSGGFPNNAAVSSINNAYAPAAYGAASTPPASFASIPEPFAKTSSSGRLGSYGIIASAKKRRNPAVLVGLMCLIAVLAGGGIFAVVTISNKNADLSTTNSVIIPAMSASAPATGPSGQHVTTSASSVIIFAQTANTLNNNYIPTRPASVFTANQTIYVSLVIESKNQAGYIMIKWYANQQLLGSDSLAHDPKNTIAFFTRKYTSSSTGNAELYWCTKADCSDAQLARVVNFTVS